GPRPRPDAGGERPRGALPPPRRRVARRPPAARRSARGSVDARGAAREPLRPGPRDAGTGVREADPPGDRGGRGRTAVAGGVATAGSEPGVFARRPPGRPQLLPE